MMLRRRDRTGELGRYDMGRVVSVSLWVNLSVISCRQGQYFLNNTYRQRRARFRWGQWLQYRHCCPSPWGPGSTRQRDHCRGRSRPWGGEEWRYRHDHASRSRGTQVQATLRETQRLFTKRGVGACVYVMIASVALYNKSKRRVPGEKTRRGVGKISVGERVHKRLSGTTNVAVRSMLK